jgi:hypothetical protein
MVLLCVGKKEHLALQVPVLIPAGLSKYRTIYTDIILFSARHHTPFSTK